MRKVLRGIIVGLCVMSAVSMTACSDKKEDNAEEYTLVRNVEEGYAYHALAAEIPADIDYGTGEYEDNIINYQTTEEKYYIGPKNYVAISDDEFVVYDRGGEQVVFWDIVDGMKFYSVKDLGVEGVYYDGYDVLLKCKDKEYYPIKDDGTISKSPKKDVRIEFGEQEYIEKVEDGENKKVAVIYIDAEKNFYTHELVYLPEYDVEYYEHRICKYDKDGNRLGYAIYDADDFVAEPDQTVVVTKNGSIYRMSCENKKVKIYKVTLGTKDRSDLKWKVKEYLESTNGEKQEETNSNNVNNSGSIHKPSADDVRYEHIWKYYNINGNTHQLLIDVLLRNAEFIDTDNGGKVTKLSEYKLADESDYMVKYYSVLDVDKDGYNEVFIRQRNNTYTVFKYEGNKVYSYQIPSESFLNVDGLMLENGTYFIPKFTTSGYTKKVLAHYEENDDEQIFYVGDKSVSRDKYVEYTSGSENERNATKFYAISDLVYFPIAEEKFARKYVMDYKLEASVPQEIVDVLLYDKEFIYNSEYYTSDDDNVIKTTKMSDFKDIYGSDPEAIRGVESYEVVDIDQDGHSEVVAYLQYPGDDVIVFHYENGVVYGYKFVFRAAQWIAPGGYLHGTGGAATNATYTLVFNKDKYTTEYRCRTESDGTYYVDEVEVSREVYSKVYDEVWGKGELQEYETLLMLLEMVDKE